MKTLAFLPADVHLRVHRHHKDGKEHRYFSIVESRRVARRRVVHRTVVYLGEINDSQQAAGLKTTRCRHAFGIESIEPEIAVAN